MNNTESYSSPIISELLEGISKIEQERTDKRMLLAARIDDARIAKGWKKSDLAKAFNKKPSEITKWLSGTHNFTSDTLFDIERILHVSLITLLDSSREQVVRFELAVSRQVKTPKGQPFPNYQVRGNYSDLLQGKKIQKSVKSDKSFKSVYQS